jgi:hypothetical protein
VEQLNSFISVLKEKYNQQGQAGKLLIPSLGLLVFCCLCAFTFSLLPAGRRTGISGFSCGYLINIWNDNQADLAVLYDSQGKEVSRYP